MITPDDLRQLENVISGGILIITLFLGAIVASSIVICGHLKDIKNSLSKGDKP